MLPTDTEKAARDAAKTLRDPRIRQFYDGNRLLGMAYMSDVFPNCIRDALTVLPPDNPFRSRLEQAATSTGKEYALWDAFLAYPPETQWLDKVPTPAFWSKQVAFWGPGDNANSTGTFWRNDCKQLPVDSDWAIEVRKLLRSFDSD